MSVILKNGRAEVFKFAETGMLACMEEVLDFVKAEKDTGRNWEPVKYYRNEHNHHVFEVVETPPTPTEYKPAYVGIRPGELSPEGEWVWSGVADGWVVAWNRF